MVRSTPRCGPSAFLLFVLAPALAGVAAREAAAQTPTTQALPPVIVTTSRFATDPASALPGTQVITAAEIREAGINNANEAIRKIGGVYGRQNFSGTQDFSLDLRGFGTNSDQNLVVMVDGVRLSENELSPALLSSIPVELIDRIEIMRGGSSVLYGSGATGGVIQVITKRGKPNSLQGTVVGEVGNFGLREMRGSVSKGWESVAIDANVGVLRSDNFRENNEVKQDTFSGGVQWMAPDARIALRLDLLRQDARFPGSLTAAQFDADPRQTLTPNDFGSIDSNRFTLSGEKRLGDIELAAELGHREKTVKGLFAGGFGNFVSDADTRTTQFSPRMRYTSNFGSWRNDLVAGFDFSRATRQTTSDFGGAPVSRADATQDSRAIYARDTLRAGKASVALGARRERFDIRSVDPTPFTTATYTSEPTLSAWELQGGYAPLSGLDLYAKVGRSYRVANIDENNATAVPNQALRPQISRDVELGAALGNASANATVRLFRHRLTDEIFFNPTVGFFGANANLDPTRRQGIEVEGSARLAPAWRLTAAVQHVSAEFTDGPNAGREMVLVPHNTAALRLNWQPGVRHSANVGLQWVDEQRFGGDFTNACTARIPSYTLLDARYAYRTGGWELAVTGSNLTDKRYYSNAFGTCSNGIYPDPGRQVKLTARYDF